MNSLGNDGHEPEGYNSGQSHFGREQKKNSPLRGCLIGILIAGALGVVCLFVVTGVVLFQALSGPSNILSSLKDERAKISEKMVIEGESEKKIIIISVHGIIYPGNNLTREHSASELLIQEFKKAKEDPEVVAVVLDMNTPGGAVTATDEVYHELLKFRDHKIKVLTCMRTIAASGGYYLAAGTDYIIANRLTLTGSIGVIIGGVNYSGLFENIGIKPEVYKSGKLKDLLNMGRPRNPGEAQIIQDIVTETHREFATIVANGRNLELEQVMTGLIGDAAIFSGRTAKELGLVDELGYLEDAIEKAKEMANVEDPSVILYTPRYSLSDLFLATITDVFNNVLPGYSGIVKKGHLYYLCPTVF